MSEDRLDRSRRTLPAGYQFGDAAVAGGAGLPTRPILNEQPDKFLQVELADGSETVITAGIAELAASLSVGMFTAYACLEPPRMADASGFYGPVLYVKVFDVDRRRMVHLLTVGVIGWVVPMPAPWRAPHLNAAERLDRSRPLNALDNLRSYSTFAASLNGGMTANVIEGEQFDTDRDPGDEA